MPTIARHPSSVLLLGIVLGSVLSFGCLGAAQAPPQDRRVDRPAATFRSPGIEMQNIVYDDADGTPTEATIVSPRLASQFPGVLFVHWYGPEHTNSNRTQFMPDAMALARRGIVSLLIDTAWTDARWFVDRAPARDAALATEQVRRLRRALEVLATLPGVDRGRLAYIGHDFGAMFGVQAAREHGPLRAYVFIAGAPRLGDWFTLGRKLDAAERKRVFDTLAPFDPLTHLGDLQAMRVLLQFGTKDPYVSRPMADALTAAVKGSPTTRFYEADHPLNSDAMNDRIAWLIESLTGSGGRS